MLANDWPSCGKRARVDDKSGRAPVCVRLCRLRITSSQTLTHYQRLLIHQVYCLLTGMLATQEAEFKQLGGIRERMTRARHEARGDERGGEWNFAVLVWGDGDAAPTVRGFPTAGQRCS